MGSWYESFPMDPVFSPEQFARYRRAVESALPFYERHLSPGARILELGCGLGVSSIPLSTFGYRVVGVDHDPRVVYAARRNAQRFGTDYRVVLGDVFDIERRFGPDSFDACDSGGLLEHFDRSRIRRLVGAQLRLAPRVLATMPVRTADTLTAYGVDEEHAEANVDRYGIYRNFWDEPTWLHDVLRGFRVREHFVEKADVSIGAFDELTVVLTRDR